MAQADTSSTTSRRALLGAMTAVPAAGALAAPAVAADPHGEWLATIDIAWRLMEDTSDMSDAEMGRLWEEVTRCQDLIAETPARSWDGVICQIRVGHHAADGLGDYGTAMAALDNAVLAIKTMAGRA